MIISNLHYKHTLKEIGLLCVIYETFGFQSFELCDLEEATYPLGATKGGLYKLLRSLIAKKSITLDEDYHGYRSGKRCYYKYIGSLNVKFN